MSMITATAWVPRGYPAEFPSKYQVDDEELARISKLAKLRLEDAKTDLEAAQNGGKPDESDGEDDEDSDHEGNGVRLPQSQG